MKKIVKITACPFLGLLFGVVAFWGRQGSKVSHLGVVAFWSCVLRSSRFEVAAFWECRDLGLLKFGGVEVWVVEVWGR